MQGDQRDIELWLAVRNIGVGLAMMPIMTSGVSALSRQLTTSGSAMNNIYQQLSSAVTTQAYDNGFYLTAWLCAGAALLAATMRSGRRAAGGESEVVEV